MAKKQLLKVLLHVIGCIVFLALPVLLAPDFPKSLNIFNSIPTQRDFIAYALMICFFYLNFFVLIPRFYITKKYPAFFSIVFLCFVIISFAPLILLPQNDKPPREFSRKEPPAQGRMNIPPNPNDSLRRPPPGIQRQGPPRTHFNNFLFVALHYIFIFIALVFFSLILIINNRLKQTEREKLQAELSYLKAQINPHFLFNALNTIYSFAIEKSGATADAVVKLSALMRYVINDAGKDFVPLEQEIDYINNYIELQQMRFGNSVNLQFSVKGETTGKIIAPLILIPFIENAFKYGVNPEEASLINIKIDIFADTLRMIVVNTKVKIAKGLEERTGLGISNSKNRLQLLYPGKHELIVKDDEKFFVSLNLNLE